MKVQGIPISLSQSCRDVNPQLKYWKCGRCGKELSANVVNCPVCTAPVRSRTRVGLRCGMNKVESEYAMILEAQKRAGEILRYEFEGITLRFANVKYTPDFFVTAKSVKLVSVDGGDIERNFYQFKVIEIKGPFILGNRERAVERFRHAKTYWPEFAFEMQQKTKDGWKQII